jgi:hypothetical protein
MRIPPVPGANREGQQRVEAGRGQNASAASKGRAANALPACVPIWAAKPLAAITSSAVLPSS